MVLENDFYKCNEGFNKKMKSVEVVIDICICNQCFYQNDCKSKFGSDFRQYPLLDVKIEGI